MKAGAWLLAMVVPSALAAQQGFLPLSRTVDGPYIALMHDSKTAAHSAIRPLLREDIDSLPGAD
ncbi:MAG: hypothetical protein ABI373_03055, partial [Flavobacteriales bacterium]